MPSPKNTAADRAAAVNETVARSQYGMALPMLRQSQERGLEGSMFPNAPYIQRGMELAGTSAIDAAIRAAVGQEKAYQVQHKAAGGGGNVSAILNPAVQLADARHKGSLNVAIANLRHGQTMMDSALGTEATGASGAASASALQLRSIQDMAEVNPALIAALAATDAAYAGIRAYQGFKKPASSGPTSRQLEDAWARESMGVD